MNAQKQQTRTAVERAAQAWGDCALEARCTLRKIGVHGELRRLDDYASGARGRAASTSLAEFSRVLLANGMSRESVCTQLYAMIERTVDAVATEVVQGGAA